MKRFGFTLLALLGTPALVLAHPLTIEDVQHLSRLSDVNASPDGRSLAYVVAVPDLKKNKLVSNIWLIGSDGSHRRAFTALAKGATHPRWSPDSKSIFYLTSDKKHVSQIFRQSIGGGSAVQVTSGGVDVDSFWLSPNGGPIVFTSAVYARCKTLACDEKMAKSRDDDPVQVRTIADVPFRRWDSWNDDKREHVFVIPARTGAAIDLTPGDLDTPAGAGTDLDVSPDGRELVFARFTANEALEGDQNLFVMPIRGGTPKQITSTKGAASSPQYSPDGRFIAYLATVRHIESDTPRLYVYDRKAGTSQLITANWDFPIVSCFWQSDSAYLWCNANHHGTLALVRIDPATQKVLQAKIDASNQDIQVTRNAVYFTHNDFAHPNEIYRLARLDPSASPVTITSTNAAALRNIQFGEASSFEFPGWNQENVQSWQVKPPQFDASKKYPLLLLMHGGPESDWSNEFHYRWNAQLFAAAGYVVIMPNFHGSIGFGTSFMDAIKGQWGGAPYEDQMKAVDVALTWPYVDPTRVSAAGASYGGYMANWVEGHTDRFRSIVSHDGLFDVLSSWYSSDFVGGVQEELKGSPWANPDALVAQSPFYYAKNFKTPMLVIHGVNDYRVDLSNGLAMFQLLQAEHVPSKLLVFKNENHWVLKPDDSIYWYHNVLGWLKQWSQPDTAMYQKMLKAQGPHPGSPI